MSNDDRSAPPQHNDSEVIEISRRIEREAGSAYRINGKDVRARDVQLCLPIFTARARRHWCGRGRLPRSSMPSRRRGA